MNIINTILHKSIQLQLNPVTLKTDIERFIEAQNNTFDKALTEVKNGKKQSHWMWYIFPQIKGLGNSETTNFYAIKDLEEANNYLKHPVLGKRLIQISNILLLSDKDNATEIFGFPDDVKLKSCMTLFASISKADSVFHLVIKKFFNDKPDEKTLNIINN